MSNYKLLVTNLFGKLTDILSWFAPISNLVARIYIAEVFFSSGLVKIHSWHSTLFLFQNEYKVPLISYTLAAFLATAVELVAPVMLVLGLGTRYGGAALFFMTLVINYTYQQMPENYYWMLLLAMFMTYGADKFSADYFIKKKWGAKNKKRS